MIKIQKLQPPEILLSPATKQAVTELLSGENKRIKKSIFKHKSVIHNLQEIYHNKCAFCESILDNVNVSTYRPKSKYPWLAYEWSNLMPICPSCNSNKRDKFPIKGNLINASSGAWHASNLIIEKPLLLHPEIDTPEEHFQIKASGRILSETENGKTTIDICGLNRKQLQFARKKKIEGFLQSMKNQIITLENFPTHSQSNESDLIKLSFTNVFDLLLKSAQPQAEFSLLGQLMIKKFDYFFTNNIESETGKEILKKAYSIFISDFTSKRHTKIKQLLIQEDDLLVTQSTPDVYFNKKNINESLLYAIKQLRIENYNGIIKTQITDIPVNTHWIFLTGENGFGKTSILQAIVLALNGTKDSNIPLISKNNKVDETKPIKIGIEVKDENSNILNNIDSENFTPIPHFAVYGPSRLNILKAYSEEKRTNQTYSIFNSDGILFNIETELSDWQTNNDERFDTVRQLLVSLLKPYIVDIHLENKKILYFEKDVKTDEIFSPKPFEHLASGFRSIIATIGDMLIRFDKNKQDITKPEKLKGFVIIDEFDLHWHPKWQRLLVSRLSNIFKNIQFIVSTHSILPLIGAPEKSVFIKINKSKKLGTTMERINLKLENLSPNIILSSPLFDTPLLSIQNRDKESFATDDDFVKWSAYEAVKKELLEKEQKRKELFELLNSKMDD